MIVDLFAGPGGWDEGLRLLDIHDVVGLEWDQAACDTAEAAGHVRHRVDVAEADPADYAGTVGLIASPPCQAFSLAGKQAGLGVIDRLLEHVYGSIGGWAEPPASICGEDVRADLTLQPLRWVDDLRPEWVALEQVPPVLPLWRAIGEVFAAWGYTVKVAKLNAANYGVPQTRTRAVLVASRVGPVSLPEPTHYDVRRSGALFGEPWVSMADALGWPDDLLTVTGATADSVARFAPRSTSMPAPPITGAGNTYAWTKDRPATTIIGAGTVAAPGHRCMSDECCGKGPRRHMDDRSINVTVKQAAILQSFRPDYPWQGSKTKQYEQVGNAVPPLLARAVLAPIIVAREQAA